MLRHACRLSLEGIVWKLRDAPYRAGRRELAQIEMLCEAGFVIGGHVPSTVSSSDRPLVRGVMTPASFITWAGSARVSPALSPKTFRELDRLRVTSSPFDGRLTSEEARQVRYVRPQLVAEIEFRAWTAEGHLRHASFRGLREDKPAHEIVREVPKSAANAAVPQQRRIKLTHPDRLYWPDEGVTKEGLTDYYTEVWRRIAPYVVGRPLALLRCPNGITGEKFFQKHAWKGLNPNIALMKNTKDP